MQGGQGSHENINDDSGWAKKRGTAFCRISRKLSKIFTVCLHTSKIVYRLLNMSIQYSHSNLGGSVVYVMVIGSGVARYFR